MIFSKIRVLIVDDDALMRTFVSDKLQRIGIPQVQEAADGKAALVSAIKFQPNLILSDIHMEPMDGIEFLKQLRALPNPAVAAIRVILMTADSNHPPAKPGAFNCVSRSKRLNGVANAAPPLWATETVATYLHSPSCSNFSSSCSWCRM